VVGDRDDVEDLEAGAGVGLQHDGSGGVGEQRVGHDLFDVLAGRLHVQRGQLQAEQHRGTAARGDEVGDGAE
jgi:hypothetical protein